MVILYEQDNLIINVIKEKNIVLINFIIYKLYFN